MYMMREFKHKVSTWSVIIFIFVFKKGLFYGEYDSGNTNELDLHVSTGYNIAWYERKYS